MLYVLKIVKRQGEGQRTLLYCALQRWRLLQMERETLHQEKDEQFF